jgi:hypothetical protein
VWSFGRWRWRVRLYLRAHLAAPLSELVFRILDRLAVLLEFLGSEFVSDKVLLLPFRVPFFAKQYDLNGLGDPRVRLQGSCQASGYLARSARISSIPASNE